jgi:hypothetical protein
MPSEARTAVDRRRQLSGQRGDIGSDRLPAREGAIPLQHRELGVVMRTGFTRSKDLAQAVDARQTGDEQPLELIFRRGNEITRRALLTGICDGKTLQMEFQTRRWNDQGRFYFQEVVTGKVATNRRQRPAPLREDLPPPIAIDPKVVAARRRKRLTGSHWTRQQRRGGHRLARLSRFGGIYLQLDKISCDKGADLAADRKSPQLVAVIDEQRLRRHFDKSPPQPRFRAQTRDG